MPNEIWARIPDDIFDEFIRFISHKGTKQSRITFNSIIKLMDKKIRKKQMTESDANTIIGNILDNSQYIDTIKLREDKKRFDRILDNAVKMVFQK